MEKKRSVLMSIRPKYVEEILSGKKLFEFRKAVFKEDDVQKVIIYASSPVKRIVAEFDIKEITSDTPEAIWKECAKYAGIDKHSFMEYFSNKKKAFSIGIHNLKIFNEPIDPYKGIDGFRPPQSYMFMNQKLDKLLNSRQFV